MDLWQLNQMRIIKRRIDDLTSIVFCFIAYEVGGLIVAGVYLLFEVSMRIYKYYQKKNQKIRVNSPTGEVINAD